MRDFAPVFSYRAEICRSTVRLDRNRQSAISWALLSEEIIWENTSHSRSVSPYFAMNASLRSSSDFLGSRRLLGLHDGVHAGGIHGHSNADRHEQHQGDDNGGQAVASGQQRHRSVGDQGRRSRYSWRGPCPPTATAGAYAGKAP